MHIHTRKNGSQVHGGVMIVALLTATIIGICLASYMIVVCLGHRSAVRSLAWNSCIPVLEAGVEEALSQIHFSGITNLNSNGWTNSPDGLYHKSRTIGDDGSYYEVSITPVNPPVIVSKGYVPATLARLAQYGMIP